jgi:hypothetical protein
MIRSQRARLRSLVALAADAIAPNWPLDTFVAVNPLLGFEDASFDDATARAAALYRARVFPGAPRETTTAASEFATLGDWCTALGWGDIVASIGERTGRWLAAYCDRAEAAWAMPHRERGFYGAWKALARHENALTTEATAYRRAIDTLPARADDALLEHLVALAIPPERWSAYLQRHLVQAAGWTGFIKRATDAGDLGGIDIIALLAVRMWYERCAVVAGARRNGCDPTFAALQTRVLLDLPRDPRGGESSDHAAALRRLEGRETAFRDALLARIARVPVTRATAGTQMVFCIDARSEPFRRALEAAGDIETLGFAGFFGMPVRYRRFDAANATAQAPVLVRPTHTIDERPDALATARLARVAARARANGALAKGALRHPLAAFAGVEAFGAFSAARAATLTFVARRAKRPAPNWPLTIDALPPNERVLFAETALRMMGLTRGFAPLVVLCGHGGGTTNNAFASALDCGACGGNRGGINARIAATILNDAGVRLALGLRGIAIPAGTQFLAAEHDTTRDAVDVFADDAWPAHARRVASLREALRRAGTHARARRAATLPAAPLGAGDPCARAGDWAQVRPEWGLARNAALIVAPRSLTRDHDLDGRCFLHSYDPDADDDGRVLEQILTAPMIVAEWINLQYFFATVDPERFGSGDKGLQQPVGGFGVVSGNGGDLRTGLPLQSTTNGASPYHEPLRLLAVVYAPPARIATIVARQQVLQRLFDHRWVSLVAIDPSDGRAQRYAGASSWIPHESLEKAACSQIV